VKQTAMALSLILAATLVAYGQRWARGGFGGRQAADTVPQANSESERKILSVLAQAQSAGELYENVPVTDGRMIRLLTETQGTKNAVEIGTSTGLSGLWFCLALQKTGGTLTTFEYDAGRAATARKHFKAAGVDSIVNVVEGDAHQTISRLKGPIDIAFVDADKGGYLDYLNKLLPLVRPGGLILAHNIEMAPDYDRAVRSNPALDTVYYTEGGGLAITLKKR
jgi:caffeoyl-CoA O-methyltransferase